jgi:hypothetical protein
MMTFKNTLMVALAVSSLLIQTWALKSAVDFGCPKGFYCAYKKKGGEWCTGHDECLSGECLVGVGCAMTTNEVTGSGGCDFDSDCDVGLKCHTSVCYVPDVPQAVESTPQQQEEQQEQQQNGLRTGGIAGIVIAAVLVVLIVAGWIAMRASKSQISDRVGDEEGEHQDKKDEDGVITEAGSDAGVDAVP